MRLGVRPVKAQPVIARLSQPVTGGKPLNIMQQLYAIMPFKRQEMGSSVGLPGEPTLPAQCVAHMPPPQAPVARQHAPAPQATPPSYVVAHSPHQVPPPPGLTQIGDATSVRQAVPISPAQAPPPAQSGVQVQAYRLHFPAVLSDSVVAVAREEGMLLWADDDDLFVTRGGDSPEDDVHPRTLFLTLNHNGESTMMRWIVSAIDIAIEHGADPDSFGEPVWVDAVLTQGHKRMLEEPPESGDFGIGVASQDPVTMTQAIALARFLGSGLVRWRICQGWHIRYSAETGWFALCFSQVESVDSWAGWPVRFDIHGHITIARSLDTSDQGTFEKAKAAMTHILDKLVQNTEDDHFRTTGIFYEPIAEASYAWVDLRVSDPLHRTCCTLVAELHKHVKVPKWARRTAFHASFWSWRPSLACDSRQDVGGQTPNEAGRHVREPGG